MAEFLYQFFFVLFMVQGIAIPFVVVAMGMVWYRQSQRTQLLKRHLAPGSDREMNLDSILRGLPKLQPLNCAKCGAGLLLKRTETFCPHCQSHGDLPADYAALAPMRRCLEKLSRRALRYWRLDYGLTRPFTEWLFKLLILMELCLLPGLLISSHYFPEPKIAHYLESMEKGSFLGVSLAAMFGFVIWILVFYLMGRMSRELRNKLPVIPHMPSSAPEEIVNCQDCGGAIGYDAGAFAAICPYCHVINLRAQLIRREKALKKQQQTKTKLILFGAMEILDDFIGSFVMSCALLALLSVIIVAYRGCEIYFHNLIPQF